MAEKRSGSVPSRLVRILIPIGLLYTIPASALRGLPHDGSVGDLLDALITREMTAGFREYEQHHGTRRRR